MFELVKNIMQIYPVRQPVEFKELNTDYDGLDKIDTYLSKVFV